MRKFKFNAILYLINHRIRMDNPVVWIDNTHITLVEGQTALTLNIQDIENILTMMYK